MEKKETQPFVPHLVLATISFAVCFAAWGLISAFAPRFRTMFALSATQTALLVAVPVLLGSLARIPMGMLTDRFGVCWPCPTPDHPGTPRLFEAGRFFHPGGKARFLVAPFRESGDPVDNDFPTYLTTGRVISQYLSGTQTRRIGALVDAYPEPRLEIHPRLAEQLGIQQDDWVTVATRRGEITLQAMVVRTIRPDTVFIPYHWAGNKSANLLTH